MATKVATEGMVSQVIGAVVDVEFPPGKQPSIFDAVEVTTRDDRKVIMEVEQAIGDNAVRCIAMDSTDGFRRGDPVRATGGPITSTKRNDGWRCITRSSAIKFAM